MPIVETNKKLKILAINKNVELQEIAQRLGVSPALVSLYANGHKPVPYESLGIISEMLSVSKKQLMEDLNVVK